MIDELLSDGNASLIKISNLVVNIQNNIQDNDGKGLLIVIDELGKFLEYSARHESILILVATLAFSMRNFLHANLPSVAFGLLSK
jgi:hypothetical protein